MIQDDRIARILSEAQNRFGYLMVEEGYWVLFETDGQRDARWIPAMNETDRFKANSHFPGEIDYTPSKTAKEELLNQMDSSSLVLHIHNHPRLFEHLGSGLLPSPSDREFARYWKSLRPELSKKMRFFIVAEGESVEYSETTSIFPASEILPVNCGQDTCDPQASIVFTHRLTKEERKEVRKLMERARKRNDKVIKIPIARNPRMLFCILVATVSLLLLLVFISIAAKV